MAQNSTSVWRESEIGRTMITKEKFSIQNKSEVFLKLMKMDLTKTIFYLKTYNLVLSNDYSRAVCSIDSVLKDTVSGNYSLDINIYNVMKKEVCCYKMDLSLIDVFSRSSTYRLDHVYPTDIVQNLSNKGAGEEMQGVVLVFNVEAINISDGTTLKGYYFQNGKLFNSPFNYWKEFEYLEDEEVMRIRSPQEKIGFVLGKYKYPLCDGFADYHDGGFVVNKRYLEKGWDGFENDLQILKDSEGKSYYKYIGINEIKCD